LAVEGPTLAKGIPSGKSLSIHRLADKEGLKITSILALLPCPDGLYRDREGAGAKRAVALA